MIMRTTAVSIVGGFDPRYFLYLEDADLTRSMSNLGRCVHLPLASVQHIWGRGSYQNIYLALINIQSACMYFLKWGISLW